MAQVQLSYIVPMYSSHVAPVNNAHVRATRVRCDYLILLYEFEKQMSYLIFTLPTKETHSESNRHILPFRFFQRNISAFLSDTFWSIIQGFSVYIE